MSFKLKHKRTKGAFSKATRRRTNRTNKRKTYKKRQQREMYKQIASFPKKNRAHRHAIIRKLTQSEKRNYKGLWMLHFKDTHSRTLNTKGGVTSEITDNSDVTNFLNANVYPTDVAKSHISVHSYVITEYIASGGFGKVFKGYRKDDTSKTSLAIKILHKNGETQQEIADKFNEDLTDETNNFRSISDSLKGKPCANYVVLLHDSGVDSGHVIVVMDFFDGMDLIDYITKRTEWGEQYNIDTLKFLHKLPLGLKCIHDAGFFHNDIKPENIMVNKNYTEIRYIDMGSILSKEKLITKRTTDIDPNMLAKYRTESYLFPSPIAESAESAINFQANDLWTLGLVLYKLITLNDPPEDLTMAQLLREFNNKTAEQREKLAKQKSATMLGYIKANNDIIVFYDWARKTRPNTILLEISELFNPDIPARVDYFTNFVKKIQDKEEQQEEQQEQQQEQQEPSKDKLLTAQ